MVTVEASGVEQRGIEHVPDEERYGTPRRQFWVWSAANLSMLPVGYGLLVVAIGLNWWQAMLAVVIGICLSYPLVGAVAVAGTRGGAPAMMLSRASFGVLGSRLPTLITWFTVVGWETVSVALGALATRTVLERLSPGLGNTGMVAVAFAVIAIGTIVLGVYGYHVIQRVQRWLTLITAVVTVVYLIVVLPRLHFDLSGGHAGSAVTLLGGIVLVMAGTGLGWLAAGADYSRYLPRSTPKRSILGWTAAGGGVTQGLLVLVGVLLSTSDPSLAAAVSRDPIGALAAQAPTWFLVPYLISVILSVTAAGAVDLYSSGLVLQAIGVRLPRPVTAGIDGVLMIVGGVYIVFVAPTFAAVFIAFLLISGVAAAAWAAVFLVDLWLHRRDGYDTAALDDADGRYGRFNWAGIGSMVIGTVVGLGLVTSADPQLAVITGFLLPDSIAHSPLAITNLGIVLGFLLSGLLYAALTVRTRTAAREAVDVP
ncbi:purine-cytosine permease family protein [Kutzneria chonburiensis]|uniref:Purine-cytosine permease family protein n=1 Tax=Kutzneria chonburiensis TaxID=1483604 RepID=A0ABV6N645_9PSEU|nr:cytosine permease [Kutzneria chonburiensis]